MTTKCLLCGYEPLLHPVVLDMGSILFRIMRSQFENITLRESFQR